MNTLVKPENIRIYRKSNGTYTIRPEGKYAPWLSHFDRLTSLTVSVYPSGVEARKEVELTWGVRLPEKLPAYLDLGLNALPPNGIPGHDRMTVTVEDMTYLGFHLGTVSIVGINSPQREREKIQYANYLPKSVPPIHHQILPALDDFCKNVENPAQSEDYRDSFGHFYTRFWWNGNGVEVTLSTVQINDEERRGHGLLNEIIDHLKLDSRVTQIMVESVHSTRLKEYLKRSGFKESAPTYFILSRNESWN